MSEEQTNQEIEFNPESLLDDILNRNDDELIPWESCVLPSKGLYYREDSPIPTPEIPGGVVKVRPMGIYADKALSTGRLLKSGEAFDYIFNHCVKLPSGMEPLDLLSEDRVFLLYYLRGITHGNEYEFMMKCPYCNGMSHHIYDLNELYDTKISPNEELGGEPFKVVLPYLTEQLQETHPGSEFWVKVRLLRGHDTMDFLGANTPKADTSGLPVQARNRKNRGKHKRDVAKFDKVMSRSENLDETIEENINRLIVEVMGSTDRRKIKQIVGKMHSRDTSTIMSFLKENTPGIDTLIETNCSKCQEVIEVPLPITESFFRPEGLRRTRT